MNASTLQEAMSVSAAMDLYYMKINMTARKVRVRAFEQRIVEATRLSFRKFSSTLQKVIIMQKREIPFNANQQGLHGTVRALYKSHPSSLSCGAIQTSPYLPSESVVRLNSLMFIKSFEILEGKVLKKVEQFYHFILALFRFKCQFLFILIPLGQRRPCIVRHFSVDIHNSFSVFCQQQYLSLSINRGLPTRIKVQCL